MAAVDSEAESENNQQANVADNSATIVSNDGMILRTLVQLASLFFTCMCSIYYKIYSVACNSAPATVFGSWACRNSYRRPQGH